MVMLCNIFVQIPTTASPAKDLIGEWRYVKHEIHNLGHSSMETVKNAGYIVRTQAWF